MKLQLSELEMASARVREMVLAIDSSEKDLELCHIARNEALTVLNEADRDLSDTKDLLQAKVQKMNRELASVKDLTVYAMEKYSQYE